MGCCHSSTAIIKQTVPDQKLAEDKNEILSESFKRRAQQHFTENLVTEEFERG